MVIPQNARGKKRFYWDLVLNNYTSLECECVNEEFEKIADAYIVAKEIGSGGTPHLQCCIKLKKGNYKSYLLNIFKKTIIGNRFSIREGRNINAMKEYCLKDGNIMYIKNVENISSEKIDVEKMKEERMRHILCHNEILNEVQIKYLKEKNNWDTVLPKYKEMIECKYCKY